MFTEYLYSPALPYVMFNVIIGKCFQSIISKIKHSMLSHQRWAHAHTWNQPI